jgi:hypothetical protein
MRPLMRPTAHVPVGVLGPQAKERGMETWAKISRRIVFASVSLTISGSMALRMSLLWLASYRRTSLLSPLQQHTQSEFHGQHETPRRLRLSITQNELRSG